MSTDVIARLAAANPFPHEAPFPRRAPSRRQLAVALVAAAVVAVPATAFAGKIGDVLGIGNSGTTVPSSSVLPGQTKLDEAMQELQAGGTMQYLGTLNGVAFYASRNADGHFCLAIDHVDAQYEKGFGCDLNADGFPSARVPVLDFFARQQLQGVAADGVATVEALDADGNVLDSTPVVNNLFVSDAQLPQRPSSIVSLDGNGAVIATQKLPG